MDKEEGSRSKATTRIGTEAKAEAKIGAGAERQPRKDRSRQVIKALEKGVDELDPHDPKQKNWSFKATN